MSSAMMKMILGLAAGAAACTTVLQTAAITSSKNIRERDKRVMGSIDNNSIQESGDAPSRHVLLFAYARSKDGTASCSPPFSADWCAMMPGTVIARDS